MNEERKKLLIELLEEVDPKKPYGTKLFDALAQITISVAIEAVCLRCGPKKNKVEVYLTQRSQDDTAYPGEWHCPGSVMRPGENVKDVFVRLCKKEFGTTSLPSTKFVANINHPTEARGHFLSVTYLCELMDSLGSQDFDLLKGKWFSVDDLPEKTVESHCKRIIPAAFGAFVAADSSICV